MGEIEKKYNIVPSLVHLLMDHLIQYVPHALHLLGNQFEFLLLSHLQNYYDSVISSIYNFYYILTTIRNKRVRFFNVYD